MLCDLQTRLDATETPNLNISKYLRGTWIRTGTIWSMLDPRRHPTINIATGVAEGAVGTAKEYFGTRRQRSQLGVVEYVTKMVGEDGFLCEEALRFQSAGADVNTCMWDDHHAESRHASHPKVRCAW